jgi:hypothetical protein
VTTRRAAAWIRGGSPVLGILAGVATSGLLAGPAGAAGTGYSGTPGAGAGTQGTK